MSVIPAKFKCDVEGCAAEAVTFEEAAQRNWFVATYSAKPKYVAINPWGSIGNIPNTLTRWHACNWTHAKELIEAASLAL